MTSEAVELRIEQARAAKALKLADTLRAHGVTADRAERYDDDQRSRVADTAGTRIPSADTWEVVVLMLRLDETGDPE